MPLADHVGAVSEFPQFTRKCCGVKSKPGGLQRLQGPLLSPDVEGVAAGEERRARGSAHLLRVALVQPQPLAGQPRHRLCRHIRVVPGHVTPAQVIRQHKNHIRLLNNFRGLPDVKEKARQSNLHDEHYSCVRELRDHSSGSVCFVCSSFPDTETEPVAGTGSGQGRPVDRTSARDNHRGAT